MTHLRAAPSLPSASATAVHDDGTVAAGPSHKENEMSTDPKSNEPIKDMPEKKLDKSTADEVKGGTSWPNTTKKKIPI